MQKKEIQNIVEAGNYLIKVIVDAIIPDDKEEHKDDEEK